MSNPKLYVEELQNRALITVNEYGGIAPPLEVFYIQSIIYSAGRCLDSFAEYERYKSTDVEAEYLISVIQEAVGHAAALSRYFWPSVQKKNRPLEQLKIRRGEKLREAFSLSEASPLYNRDLRNTWEHFDERLDEYLLNEDSGIFFPSCIVGSHTLADDPIGRIFKLLDTDAECLVLLACKYFFAPIHEEVKSVLAKAIDADRQGGRFSRI